MAWNIYWVSLKGFIRDTGPFFLIPIILGNLSKPRNIFHTWTWVSTSLWGLGFLELWDFLPGLLVQILGTFAYLVNIGIWTSCLNFFFYGLCDRTWRPNIGQRKYSSRGSPLPTRWVRAPLLDWLSICLVIHSSFAPGGAGSLRSSTTCRVMGTQWLSNGLETGNQSIISLFFIWGNLFIWDETWDHLFLFGKLMESLLGNLSWNLLSAGEHLILAPPLIHGLGIYP